MTIRHEFPCKQHSDYRSARYQRKHVNLLLLDSCEEYSRTYGHDGKPQEHATIETALKRTGGRQLQSKVSTGTISVVKRTKDLWQSAAVEGGQEAADLAKQVGSKRTPAGTFFGLANPGLARPAPATDGVPNMRQQNLTQVIPQTRAIYHWLSCVLLMCKQRIPLLCMLPWKPGKQGGHP